MPYKWEKYYLLLPIAALMPFILPAQSVVVNESLQTHSAASLKDLLVFADSTKRSPFIISDIEVMS